MAKAKKPIQKTINIKINSIDIFSKNIYRTVIKETDEFMFDVSTQTGLDSAMSLVVIFVRVNIKHTPDRKTFSEDVSASVMIGVSFKIENFEQDLEKTENGEYGVPKDLENMLKTVSISTMRGVMYSEFRGTPFHKAILPIIFSDTLKPTNDNLIGTIK